MHSLRFRPIVIAAPLVRVSKSHSLAGRVAGFARKGEKGWSRMAPAIEWCSFPQCPRNRDHACLVAPCGTQPTFSVLVSPYCELAV